MNLINSFLDKIRGLVRALMTTLAKWLNSASHGRITPNMITITSFLAHFVIAYLIATRHPIWGALLLVVFGLFDALDGALARVQNTSSSAGMLLDASLDKMKEVLLYVGAAAFYVALSYPDYAVWAVAACGASLCVSYVKAKGETAVQDKDLSPNEVNRLFQDGFARYEIRMFLFIVGLVTALLPEMLVVITILSTWTAFGRLIRISKAI